MDTILFSFFFFKESQKYFEETTQQKELEHQSLKDMVRTKETEIVQKDEDLRQIIVKHERDMQQIMSKGEVNIQDEVRTATKVPLNTSRTRKSSCVNARGIPPAA